MAERRPLVIKDGRIEEIPSGDTISDTIAPGTGGGGASYPSFTGNDGKVLAVNSAEDDVEWIDPPADGTDGTDGTDGVGVPAGGTTGQVLKKTDGTDYNTEWADESGGGGVSLPSYTGNTGKVLAVNGAEDGVEWVDDQVGSGSGPSGTQPTYEYWRWTFTANPTALFTIGYIVPDAGIVGTFSEGATTYGDADAAFDLDADNFWGATQIENTNGTGWIQIQYTTPTWINSYDIVSRSGSGNQAPDSWVLEASHDGTNWDTIDTVTGENSWGDIETRSFTSDVQQPESMAVFNPIPSEAGFFLKAKADGTSEWDEPLPSISSGDARKKIRVNDTEDGYEIETPDATNTYKNWRLQLTEAGTYDGGALGEIEMYGEASGPDLTEGGTAFASDESYGYAVDVFNGSANDWATDTSETLASGNVWIGYTFKDPVWIHSYLVKARASNNGTQTSRGWNLQYLDHDGNWVTSDPVTGEAQWSNDEERTFTNAGSQPAAVTSELPYHSSNQRGKHLRVSVDGMTVEWDEGAEHIPDTGTTYTITENDLAGNVFKTMDNLGAITITVDPSMVNQEPCTFIQTNDGQITFAPGSGVTISSADGKLKTRAKFSSATLVPDKNIAETYYLIGDLDT